jgi:hypothetical protein
VSGQPDRAHEDLRDWRDVVPTFDRTAISNTYIVLRSAGVPHQETMGELRNLFYYQLRGPVLVGAYTSYVLAIAELTEPFSGIADDDWSEPGNSPIPIAERVDKGLYQSRNSL